MDQRILDAALHLYGSVGWLGFNLDAVAKGAKVSKDALYRRWPTRETLIADALRARWDWVAAIDTGTIREDLMALCERTFDTFAGAYGEAALQLRADARHFPEVRLFADPDRDQIVRLARDIVRRAIARGELPGSAQPGLIMDLLVGGVTNHILSTPSRLQEQMLAKAGDFMRTMVDVVLAGVRGVAD